MKYLIGQTVILQATFRDTSLVLTDPATVTLTVEDPDDNVSSPIPTNPSVGIYQHQLVIDAEGWWDFRFEGSTSEGVAVCEGNICAVASALVGT